MVFKDIALVGAGAVLGAAIAIGYLGGRISAIESDMSVSPRIVVMPVTKLLVDRANNGQPVDQALADAREATRRLVEQGFVVLDSDHVYGYPKSLEVVP